MEESQHVVLPPPSTSAAPRLPLPPRLTLQAGSKGRFPQFHRRLAAWLKHADAEWPVARVERTRITIPTDGEGDLTKAARDEPQYILSDAGFGPDLTEQVQYPRPTHHPTLRARPQWLERENIRKRFRTGIDVDVAGPEEPRMPSAGVAPNATRRMSAQSDVHPGDEGLPEYVENAGPYDAQADEGPSRVGRQTSPSNARSTEAAVEGSSPLSSIGTESEPASPRDHESEQGGRHEPPHDSRTSEDEAPVEKRPKASAAMLRKEKQRLVAERMREEAEARRLERPFEMEADLTEEGIEMVSAGDAEVARGAKKTRAARGLRQSVARSRRVATADQPAQTPARPPREVLPFEDLTAVTTPGLDSTHDVGDNDDSPLPLRARRILAAKKRHGPEATAAAGLQRPQLALIAGKEPPEANQTRPAADASATPEGQGPYAVTRNGLDRVTSGQSMAANDHEASQTASESATEVDPESPIKTFARKGPTNTLLDTAANRPSDLATERLSDAVAAVNEAQLPNGPTSTRAARAKQPATGGGASSLSEALREEEDEARKRKAAAASEHLDRLRGQQKRQRRRGRDDAAASAAAGPSESRQDADVTAAVTTAATAVMPAPQPRASGSTSFSSSRVRSMAVGDKGPKEPTSFASYEACVLWWEQRGRKDRLVQARPAALAGLDVLLVGERQKLLTGWVRRLLVQGANVLTSLPTSTDNASSSSTPTYIVSVGIPKPPDATTCAALLELPSGDLTEIRQKVPRVAFVTQAWMEESIARGKPQTADDPRWKLA